MSLSPSHRRSVVASILALTSILLVAACASAGHPRDASSRQLRGTDTTFAAGRSLYRDCAADALFATLPTWKYEPAELHGRRVRQLVVEHQSIVSATVLVRAGSGPPTHSPEPVPGC